MRVRHVISAACGNYVVMMLVGSVACYFGFKPMLHVIGFFLQGLEHFGEGWR